MQGGRIFFFPETDANSLLIKMRTRMEAVEPRYAVKVVRPPLISKLREFSD